MKWLVAPLLGAIFVVLLVGSVQSISADHILRDGKGIFKDQNEVNLVRLGQEDSKYHIHLLVEVRNAQGQLISISEASDKQIKYIGYEMMHDQTKDFDKKEIIIIDDVKFEKIQVVRQLDTKQLMANKQTSHYAGFWQIITCDVIEGHGQTCIPILQSYTSSVFITEEDIITNQWTFLRNLNV